MKKIALFVGLFLVVAVLASAIAISAANAFQPDDLVMLTSERVNIKADARLELSVDFYLPAEDMDYLSENAANLRVYGIVIDYTASVVDPQDNLGFSIDLTRSGERTIGDVLYYSYNLPIGIILPEDYNKPIAVRGFVSYELNGRSHKTVSDYNKSKNVITPYDNLYSAYCDRSEKKTETHPYDAGDGTFSPIEDLYSLRKLLSSTLDLEIKDGKCRDKKENNYYKSLFGIDYIDYEGILILSLEGGEDIPEWLLEELYINGEKRYFEIHGGKIKLVV
ncbi:MAG: hypothetical protein IJD79_00115 [Clostridia bacterium]|nr:hypothetical protein [Clostridia bacterium]